jgi:hypothetical protein
MDSRLPILPAVALAVIVLLVVLWAFGPRQEPEEEIARAAAAPTAPLLKDRPLPPRRLAPPGGGASQAEVPTVEVSAEPTRTPREHMSKRDRFRARERVRDLLRTPRAASTEHGVEIESGLPEDAIGGGGGPPRAELPTPIPEIPYDQLSDDERVELIVALQRLRDSGALRSVAPEDYLRVMEIMPESQGLQDADRIFQEVLGMGVGEWLARTRGGQTFILE